MSALGDLPGVTSVEYWDDAARCWDEIHDTLVTDEKGVIEAALEAHLQQTDVAIDFGCGGGRYLAALSRRCASVVGIDISRRLLEIARRVVEKELLTNVRLRCADLGNADTFAKLALPTADVVVCANVLISPDPITRQNMIAAIAATLRPGGRLCLIVPAVGSALSIREQHPRWVAERRRRGLRPKPKLEVPEAHSVADEKNGVFCRGGVRTKHFRMGELKAQLKEAGLRSVLSTERVEYSWDTEFDPPIGFLERDPRVQPPYDWLVVAVKDERRASVSA
eukprot:5291321-Prymnesium_polylepis.2